jgi:uncharacterized repeat protein (TIGR01451 family)
MKATQDVGLKVVYPMTIYNAGNGTDSLTVSSTISSIGLTWTYYVDANKDGILDGGDYLFPTGTTTPPIVQEDSLYILAVATIPTATADESVDPVSFFFVFDSDPTVKDTVKAITTVRAPEMALVKSVFVVPGHSPVSGKPAPGDTVEYTIAYSDTGTGAADNIVITDSIPAKTTYVSGSVILAGAYVRNPASDGSDSDEVVATSTLVTVTLPHVNAGASGTIKFRVIVN